MKLTCIDISIALVDTFIYPTDLYIKRYTCVANNLKFKRQYEFEKGTETISVPYGCTVSFQWFLNYG